MKSSTAAALPCALLGFSMTCRSPSTQHTLSDREGPYAVAFNFHAVTVRNQLLNGGWWGGGGRTLPEQAVASVTVERNGLRVHVPRSAYADLSNVNQMWLVRTRRGCDIRLQGGDAHASYFGRISVVGDAVVERVIRMGEFPKHHWEATKYHDQPIEDE